MQPLVIFPHDHFDVPPVPVISEVYYLASKASFLFQRRAQIQNPTWRLRRSCEVFETQFLLSKQFICTVFFFFFGGCFEIVFWR